MKKVMLLVLTVMLVSAFLMASGPTMDIKRLTVINKSGNDVMIKLEGSDIGQQFYYLTIPAGTKEWPTVQDYTVLEDIYKRTTWYGEGDNAQCVGWSSTGWLNMGRNVRLVFTPCYTDPPNAGEPTMEKVVYYKYAYVKYGSTDGDAQRCGYWLTWDTSSVKVPNLCQWHYIYGGLD
jgi:hypothetical protein